MKKLFALMAVAFLMLVITAPVASAHVVVKPPGTESIMFDNVKVPDVILSYEYACLYLFTNPAPGDLYSTNGNIGMLNTEKFLIWQIYNIKYESQGFTVFRSLLTLKYRTLDAPWKNRVYEKSVSLWGFA